MLGAAVDRAARGYVLHCFQKNSKSGIKTPKEDMALINARLKAAKQDYELWKEQQGARG